jgi:hypothetical protein
VRHVGSQCLGLRDIAQSRQVVALDSYVARAAGYAIGTTPMQYLTFCRDLVGTYDPIAHKALCHQWFRADGPPH